MNTREIEQALAAWRSNAPVEIGVPLSTDEALGIRNAGNLPDEDDRSLRLVLLVDEEPLERKRLRYEPDFHRAPEWRLEGSRPVNVVPLRTSAAPAASGQAWWETPRVRELEEGWQATGIVAGMHVPAEYRSFVFKTVIALQDAGQAVTPSAVGDSVARWLSPEDAMKIRQSLEPEGPGV